MGATAFQRKRRELAALEAQRQEEQVKQTDKTQENQQEQVEQELDTITDLSRMKKDELMELAKEREIEVTSKMTKEQLIEALQKQG